jgi:hypothetical protein
MFPDSLPAALTETLVLGNVHTLRERACDRHGNSPKVALERLRKAITSPSRMLHVC